MIMGRWKDWWVACWVVVLAMSMWISPSESMFLPMGVSLLRSLDGYNGSSAAVFKEKIRSSVVNHLQSISQELISFNKDLTDLTDSFAVSVKTVTSDIKSKASMQMRDHLERVRSKLNETVSSLTGSSVRPVVLHYVDGQSLTLDCLKHLLRAQRRLQQAGYQYHVIYSHDSRKSSSGSNNVAMLEGLFTDESLTIVGHDQLRQFLARHFSGYSSYFFDPQATLMDFIVLYWLSTRGWFDVTASAALSPSAAAAAVGPLSSTIPPYIWVLDGGLLWQGDLSRLIASLTDDPLFPADYMVLPRDAFQTATDLHFGPLDRRRVYRDVSRDIQRIVQNLLPPGNFSSILTPLSAATNFSSLLTMGNTLLSLLPSRRNESVELVEPPVRNEPLADATEPSSPTWTDEQSSIAQITKRLQPHPWIVRYSAAFFQSLVKSLRSCSSGSDDTTDTAGNDAADLAASVVKWQSLDIRTPLVAHVLQHPVVSSDGSGSRGGVGTSSVDGADRSTAANLLASWLSRNATSSATTTRLICVDLSSVVRQKHLFTSSWQAHANGSTAAIFHRSVIDSDDNNDDDGNGTSTNAATTAAGIDETYTSTADFFYLSSN